MGRGRSRGNWKYRLVKKMKHRALKRIDRASTIERREAWKEIVAWLDDILDNGRYVNKNGSIAIPGEIPKEEEVEIR